MSAANRQMPRETARETARENTGPQRANDPSLPQVFGRYLLLQRLSRGGMGEIFLAKHGLAGFEKLCVIKKVLPDLAEDQSFISRFIDEARVAIQLQHANIAQVFEVGRVEDEYFLAIEYVEGRDLRRTLSALSQRGRRLPLEHVLFIGREIANGLAYAHRRTDERGSSLRLVHCDISPPNVVVSFEGETKLIDFGIAKSAKRATATDPQMGFGKFGYMAPEQLIRGGVVDHRTDIYATGVVLHELMTGARLYDVGENPDYRALARKVARGEHALPSDIDPGLAPYDELVAKALRPNPDERYQTAAALRDAIQHALVAIHPTMSADHLGSFMRQAFAEEMRIEREVAARARALDLRDFEKQLTTQSATTVSYALANMPLWAPETGSIRLSDLPDSAATGGPNPALETALVDRVRHRTAPPHRGRRIAIAAAASLALMGGVALAFVVAGEEPRLEAPPASPGAADSRPAAGHSAGAAPTATPLPTVVPAPTAAVAAASPGTGPEVTPIVVETAAAVPEPDVVSLAPPSGSPSKRGRAVAKRAAGRRADSHAAKAPSRPAPAPAAATAPIASDAVLAKFRELSRDYRAFKERYGARLEGQWADLATYAQFAKSSGKLEILDKKIDAFRGSMKRAE
jgi:eukaryotic-like serine/threonine-protein kinase